MKFATVAALLISTAQGFTVPPPVDLSLDSLVFTLPGTSQSLSLSTTIKTALLPFIVYAPFFTEPVRKHEPLETEEEVDYDAPIERQIQVGHVVRRQGYTLGFGNLGTVELPPSIQLALDLYRPEDKFHLPHIVADYSTMDECYLGKDLQAKECVDFDPPHYYRPKQKLDFHYMAH